MFLDLLYWLCLMIKIYFLIQPPCFFLPWLDLKQWWKGKDDHTHT